VARTCPYSPDAKLTWHNSYLYEGILHTPNNTVSATPSIALMLYLKPCLGTARWRNSWPGPNSHHDACKQLNDKDNYRLTLDTEPHPYLA